MLNLKCVCVLLSVENECISSTASVCEFKWGSWRKHIYMLLAQMRDLENGGGSLIDLIVLNVSASALSSLALMDRKNVNTFD